MLKGVEGVGGVNQSQYISKMADLQCCLLLAAHALKLTRQAREQNQYLPRGGNPNPDWST